MSVVKGAFLVGIGFVAGVQAVKAMNGSNERQEHPQDEPTAMPVAHNPAEQQHQRPQSQG